MPNCLKCGKDIFIKYPSWADRKYCSMECTGTKSDGTLEERFWRNVQKTENCWLWTAGKTAAGYGVLHPKHGETILAHRFAWTLANGPIPDGISICHHCDNPPCVNPAHLFPGTPLDNQLDKYAKGRGQTGGKHWTNRNPHLIPRGLKHPNGRLSDRDVQKIREAVATGSSQKDVARDFEVSPSYISMIVAGLKR